MTRQKRQLLFGTLLALGAGVAVGWFRLLQPALESRAILASWHKNMSTVIRNEWRCEDSATWSDILYEYEFQGKKYRSCRVSIPEKEVVLSTRQVGPGFQLWCYVNPENPEQAIIYPEFSPSAIWLALCGMFIFCGVLAACGLFRPDRELNPPSFCTVVHGEPNRSVAPELTPQSVAWTALRPERGLTFQGYHLEMTADCCSWPVNQRWQFAVWGAMGMAAVMGYFGYRFWASQIWGAMGLAVVFALAVGIGGGMAWRRARRRLPRFSRSEGRFSTGAGEETIPLREIAALQLLEKTVAMGKYRTECVELNLILCSGKRCFVVESGNSSALRADARKLADFLGGVPIWDNRERAADFVRAFSPADDVATAPDVATRFMVHGGNVIHAHRLRESGDKIEFVMRPGYVIIPVLVMAGGLTLAGWGVWSIWVEGFSGMLLGVVVGMVFFISTLATLFQLAKRKVVFDRNLQAYYRDRRNPARMAYMRQLNGFTRFQDIAALQLLAQRVEVPDGTPYVAYELNLILKNATRVNVLNHADRAAMLRDTGRIAEFLNVPIRGEEAACHAGVTAQPESGKRH